MITSATHWRKGFEMAFALQHRVDIRSFMKYN